MKNINFSYISLFNFSTTSSLLQNICRDNDEDNVLSVNDSEKHNVSSPRSCSTPDIPERTGSSADCRKRKKRVS